MCWWWAFIANVLIYLAILDKNHNSSSLLRRKRSSETDLGKSNITHRSRVPVPLKNHNKGVYWNQVRNQVEKVVWFPSKKNDPADSKRSWGAKIDDLLRARFQGQNCMVKISHLSKSSVPISNIWLFSWSRARIKTVRWAMTLWSKCLIGQYGYHMCSFSFFCYLNLLVLSQDFPTDWFKLVIFVISLFCIWSFFEWLTFCV